MYEVHILDGVVITDSYDEAMSLQAEHEAAGFDCPITDNTLDLLANEHSALMNAWNEI